VNAGSREGFASRLHEPENKHKNRRAKSIPLIQSGARENGGRQRWQAERTGKIFSVGDRETRWDKLKVGATMDRDFVESREGSFYLIGSRVPLAHLVREFQQGEPPEAIRSHYSTLSLEQVYGAITFYLGHNSEVENDIAERERVEDEFTKTHPAPPHLKEKLERARQQLLARRT
jgi:uncharacterized protein (DUF433 family)